MRDDAAESVPLYKSFCEFRLQETMSYGEGYFSLGES